MKVFYIILLQIFCGLAVFSCGHTAVAQTYPFQPLGRGEATGLDLPRFVSFRSNEVYMRSGPGTRYPVRWIYKRQNLPVEIIQEFDTWRKVRDQDGAEGWVHQSLITGRRYALIKSREAVEARRATDIDARATMKLEPGVVAKITSCNDDWCELSASGFEGWIEKKYLWGVYAAERIN